MKTLLMRVWPAVLLASAVPLTVRAADGTWTRTTSGGLWSNPANWLNNTIASGADYLADFSALDLGFNNTVQLDTIRTIGALRFGDTVPSWNWILSNNGNAANRLTLQTSILFFPPEINVVNQSATLDLGLSGTGVRKTGAGTLRLSGAVDNTGLGMTVTEGNLVLEKTSSGSVHAIGGGGLTIIGGIVRLDGGSPPFAMDQIYDFASVTVNGGTLDLNGRTETLNVLNLQGSGAGGAGALIHGSAAPSSWGSTLTVNSINLTGDTTIGAVHTTQGISELLIDGPISGNYSLTKVGSGGLDLRGSAPNTYTGTTYLNEGFLVLGKSAINATVIGNLVVGDGVGGPAADWVFFYDHNQIGDSPSLTVTVNSSGVLNVNGATDYFATLVLNGGAVSAPGPGFVSFINNIGQVISNANTQTAAISGNLNLNGTCAFSIASGTTPSGIDVDVPAVVSNGTLTKMGTGTLRLSGANTFAGGLSFTGGKLLVGHNFAAGTGTLTLAGNATVQPDGSPRLLPNAVHLSDMTTVDCTLDLTFSGNIAGAGGLTKTGAGALAFKSSVLFTGPLVFNAGTIRATGAGGLAIHDGSTILLDATRLLDVTNTLTLDNGAYLALAGGLSAGNLVNNGDFVVINTPVNPPLVNNNAVTVVGTVDFNGPVSGPGSFFGPGTAHFNGGLSPGASAAQVSIEGSIALANTNTLAMEIGGPAAGTQYDTLAVDGSAVLDGTLALSLLNNFSPSLGQSFVIMTLGSRSGTFRNVTGMSAGPGKVFRVQYNPADVVLTVGAPVPPDLDADGDVDSSDLALFSSCKTREKVSHNGTPLCQAADFDDDNDVDGNDFGVYQRCYGGANVPANQACAIGGNP